MAMSANVRLVEQAKVVQGLPPRTPSSSTPDYVCLKGYERCTIVVTAKNAGVTSPASPVTGSAITLKQNTSPVTSGEAALAFTKVWVNTDTAATDTLVETAVSNNTFTTDTTNAKDLMYVLEVEATDLVDGNDCIRVGTGNAANTTLSVVYVLHPARFAGATPLTAISE